MLAIWLASGICTKPTVARNIKRVDDALANAPPAPPEPEASSSRSRSKGTSLLLLLAADHQAHVSSLPRWLASRGCFAPLSHPFSLSFVLTAFVNDGDVGSTTAHSARAHVRAGTGFAGDFWVVPSDVPSSAALDPPPPSHPLHHVDKTPRQRMRHLSSAIREGKRHSTGSRRALRPSYSWTHPQSPRPPAVGPAAAAAAAARLHPKPDVLRRSSPLSPRHLLAHRLSTSSPP